MTWFYAALLVLGIALAGFTLVRVLLGGLKGSKSQEGSRLEFGGSQAHRILAERYAAGELDTAEYQRRLRVLKERV